VIYTVSRHQSSVIQTKLSITADTLEIFASAAAVLLSFLEDQRSVEPSVLLAIYFSGLVVLTIPRLRSLWLIPSINLCRGLLTGIYILTVLAFLLESSTKFRLLRATYQHVTREESIGFWGRSLFLWVNPIFHLGYSKILSLNEIPELDQDLQSDVALEKLEIAWASSRSEFRLIKAVFRAYSRTALNAVIPRLALSAFKFCQPFLITSTINYFESGLSDSTAETKEYGRALIGAYLLVYLGMAVCACGKRVCSLLNINSRYPPPSIGVSLIAWGQWHELG
jgi:ATP-binding cassette subfamily C (CFTR/MRP) protein 1